MHKNIEKLVTVLSNIVPFGIWFIICINSLVLIALTFIECFMKINLFVFYDSQIEFNLFDGIINSKMEFLLKSYIISLIILIIIAIYKAFPKLKRPILINLMFEDIDNMFNGFIGYVKCTLVAVMFIVFTSMATSMATGMNLQYIKIIKEIFIIVFLNLFIFDYISLQKNGIINFFREFIGFLKKVAEIIMNVIDTMILVLIDIYELTLKMVKLINDFFTKNIKGWKFITMAIVGIIYLFFSGITGCTLLLIPDIIFLIITFILFLSFASKSLRNNFCYTTLMYCNLILIVYKYIPYIREHIFNNFLEISENMMMILLFIFSYFIVTFAFTIFTDEKITSIAIKINTTICALFLTYFQCYNILKNIEVTQIEYLPFTLLIAFWSIVSLSHSLKEYLVSNKERYKEKAIPCYIGFRNFIKYCIELVKIKNKDSID